MKYLTKPLDFLACKAGHPRCHRELKNGIDYAMCNWCNRQSEVHQLGGPPKGPLIPPEVKP